MNAKPFNQSRVPLYFGFIILTLWYLYSSAINSVHVMLCRLKRLSVHIVRNVPSGDQVLCTVILKLNGEIEFSDNTYNVRNTYSHTQIL